MRAMIRRGLVLSCFAVLFLAPRAASAITVDQVVALAKSGVTDTVILALIDRDRTVFAIEPEQITALQRDGLSEKVILALLKSGRAEGDAAARADAAYNSAWIASNLTTEPLSISVGHGPDRPNTTHVDGFYSGPNLRYRTQGLGSHRSTDSPILCYAQVSTAYGVSLTPVITVCPDVMQPGRQRR